MALLGRRSGNRARMSDIVAVRCSVIANEEQQSVIVRGWRMGVG